jgi:hypothetical protein
LQLLLDEHNNEEWTLENDVDFPIGTGNEDICYFEELSNESEGGYFSANDGDGDEYAWKDGFSNDTTHIQWPPEMLHAPTTSHKRPCKWKAPI